MDQEKLGEETMEKNRFPTDTLKETENENQRAK